MQNLQSSHSHAFAFFSQYSPYTEKILLNNVLTSKLKEIISQNNILEIHYDDTKVDIIETSDFMKTVAEFIISNDEKLIEMQPIVLTDL